MFKCIHGLAPNYLCNDIAMDLYMPRVIKDIYKICFSYMATNLWNQLPTDVKELLTHLNKMISIRKVG